MIASQIAKRANVSTDTVRYYTKRGLITASKNPHNGYHEYSAEALQKLNFIVQARQIGFGLSDIEEILDSAFEGESPCPKVRQLLHDKIAQTKLQIAQLQNHLAMLEQTSSQWDREPDSTPNGNSICCLIESWAEQNEEPKQ